MEPAEQERDALAHLLSGLVGERDGQDLAGPRALGVDQPGDPVGQHAGLARARAREDQQRPARVRDGLALGRVQPRQEVVDQCFGHRRRGYDPGRKR